MARGHFPFTQVRLNAVAVGWRSAFSAAIQARTYQIGFSR